MAPLSVLWLARAGALGLSFQVRRCCGKPTSASLLTRPALLVCASVGRDRAAHAAAHCPAVRRACLACAALGWHPQLVAQAVPPCCPEGGGCGAARGRWRAGGVSRRAPHCWHSPSHPPSAAGPDPGSLWASHRDARRCAHRCPVVAATRTGRVARCAAELARLALLEPGAAAARQGCLVPNAASQRRRARAPPAPCANCVTLCVSVPLVKTLVTESAARAAGSRAAPPLLNRSAEHVALTAASLTPCSSRLRPRLLAPRLHTLPPRASASHLVRRACRRVRRWRAAAPLSGTREQRSALRLRCCVAPLVCLAASGAATLRQGGPRSQLPPLALRASRAQ